MTDTPVIMTLKSFGMIKLICAAQAWVTATPASAFELSAIVKRPLLQEQVIVIAYRVKKPVSLAARA